MPTRHDWISSHCLTRLGEAARWYAALKAGENALPHKSRTALTSGEALVRRLRRWLSINGPQGTTIGEMLRWAAAKRAAGGGSSARAGPGAWAAERQARRIVELSQAALAELEQSIGRAVAIAKGRPGDKTDVALRGLVHDLGALWAASGRRVSGRGKPLRIFYAFNPERTAILLIGGDKSGDDRFYERYIPIADKLYDVHLEELRKESTDEW